MISVFGWPRRRAASSSPCVRLKHGFACVLLMAAGTVGWLTVIRAAADDVLTFAFTIGLDEGTPAFPLPKPGVQPGQLVYPYDVDTDSQRRIYVADTESFDPNGNVVMAGDRVQVFTPTGTLLEVIGGAGDPNVQFAYPTGLAIDALDQLLVADSDNQRIAVRRVDGTWHFLGTPGTGPGEFNYPWRVAVAPGTRVLDSAPGAGRIAVVDNGNYRVQVFDGQLTYLFSLAGQGEHLSQFDVQNGPSGVAMDASGRIYVADPGNQRIAVYEPDATADLADVCVDPTDPALAGSGAADGICTTVADNGARYRTWAIGVTTGADPQLLDPYGVKLDAAGRLLVADALRHRVLRIEAGTPNPADDCSVDANWSDGRCTVTTSTGVHLDALVIGGPLTPGGMPGGSGLGQFNNPLSLAGDVLGRIVVADTDNHRVQVFEPARLAITNVEVTPGDDPLNAGDTVTLSITIQNQGGATLSVLPDVTATGVPVALTSAAPTAVLLPARESTTFSLVYALNDRGTLTFDVGAKGTASGRTVQATRQLTKPLNVAPAPEPRLSLVSIGVSPPLVGLGGTITVQMQVNNIGNIDLEVTPSMTPSPAPRASLLTAPDAAPVAAGDSHVFQYTFKAEKKGPVEFSASVTATSAQGAPPPVEPLTSTVVIQEQEPDTNPPSITATLSPSAPSAEGWFATPVAVTLVATDDKGPARIGYSLSGGDPGAGSGLTSPAVVPISVNGTSTLTYWAVDGAGNQSHPVSARPSITVRIDKITPTFTVAAPTRAPNASGWYNADVNVVFSASDAPSGLSFLFPVTPSFVTVTGEGVHPISSTATDKAGNITTSGVIVIRLDKTAPNLFNVFDPATRDVSVYARDLTSGAGADPIEPTVAPVRWGGDRDGLWHVHTRDCDHDNDDDDGDLDSPNRNARAELRTFQTGDLAGNETVLVEKVRRTGSQAYVKVLSYQFITAAGEGPIIRPAHARKKYEWSLNRDGSLKRLNQQMVVGLGRDRVEVQARYDGRKNVTSIDVHGRKGKPLKVPGLVLLRMVTDQATGRVLVEFLDQVVGN